MQAITLNMHRQPYLDFGLLVAEDNPSVVLTQQSQCPLPQVELLPAFFSPLLCTLHEVLATLLLLCYSVNFKLLFKIS